MDSPKSTTIEPLIAPGDSGDPSSREIVLEEFIPYYIRIASSRIASQSTSNILKSYGMAMAEWRVLITVHQYPGISVNEIATKLSVDKPSTSRAATSLTRRQFLKKNTDQGDQRFLALQLTEKGRATYHAIATQMLRFENAITGNFTPEDKQQLIRLLKRVCDNLSGPEID